MSTYRHIPLCYPKYNYMSSDTRQYERWRFHFGANFCAKLNPPFYVPSQSRPDTNYNVEFTSECSPTLSTRYHIQRWTHLSMLCHTQIPRTMVNSSLHVRSYPRPDISHNIELISPCSVTPSTWYHIQRWTHLSMLCHTQIPRTMVNPSLHAPSYLQPDTSYNVGLIFPCFVTAPTKYQARRLTHLSMLRHTFDQIPRTMLDSSFHASSQPRPNTKHNG